MYIIIGLLFIVLGVLGLVKSKFPEYRANGEFIANFRLYIGYIGLLALGVTLLISTIRDLFK